MEHKYTKLLATQNTIPDFDKKARELLDDAVTFAEVTGLNFFKSSFENQGWKPTARGALFVISLMLFSSDFILFSNGLLIIRMFALLRQGP